MATGRLEDASVSGAFVRTSLDPPLLAHVSVILELRTYDRTQQHEVAAYVVRRSRTGIGIEWCEFAPAVVCAILAVPLEIVNAGKRMGDRNEKRC
jgi:hypothetical protein